MQRLLPKRESQKRADAYREVMTRERNGLAEEITELTKNKNRVLAEIASAQNTFSTTVNRLNSEHLGLISSMKQEIEVLESRRREAIKPLSSIKGELDKRQAALDALQAEIAAKETRLLGYQSALVLKASELADKEALVAEREKMSFDRANRLVLAEELNRKSTSDLASKWQELREYEQVNYDAIQIANDALKRKEKEAEAEKKWCLAERLRLQEVEKKLASERIAIEDVYNRSKKKGLI